MPDTSDSAWYYAVARERTGPVPLADLTELLRTGRLKPTTLVWKQGMADWRPAAQVEELRGIVPAAPPTLPGPIQRSAPHEALGENAGVRLLIPVGRTPWAIVAGYLGLLGLIPLVGLVLAPAGIFCGVMAIRHMKRDPRQHGMGRALTGIVLGVVGTAISLSVLYSVISR